MRLTHLVKAGGCASKLGPTQLTEILKQLPKTTHPNLLVGFEHRDDAGVFLLPNGQALVQTMDFFTPIVDDPYSFGQIAAANALSDVYAMGGVPITAMNITCFDPTAAPPEVWSQILMGMNDKTVEAGAAVVGGHSVEDTQPKFGMSVTGLVDPKKAFVNSQAQIGDEIWLTKALGTGIVTTAGKFDDCSAEEMSAAIAGMVELNKNACEAGHLAGCRCATDITGFSLAGHLFNVAEASGITIELDSDTLPTLPGVERMIADGNTTGGAKRNAAFVAEAIEFSSAVVPWRRDLIFDPQTSGGLTLFGQNINFGVKIGRVTAAGTKILVR